MGRSVVAIKKELRKLTANKPPRGGGGGSGKGGIIESLRGGENQVNFIVKQPNFPPTPEG